MQGRNCTLPTRLPIAWPLALALGLLPGVHAQTPAEPASTTVVSGHLQLVWGDRAPYLAAGPASQFRASLATDDGDIIRLDTDSALHAAGNLYGLFGQRVAAAVAADAASIPGQYPLRSAAIVPVAAPTSTSAINAIGGAQPWITLMCKFTGNASAPKPKSYFTGMYGNQPGQLNHYWQQVSYGKINVSGSSAAGWFTLPHPRSYYVTMQDGKQVADLDKLFQDCTAAANPTVDFSQFVGIGQVFNDELDNYAWGGGRYAALDGPSRLWRVTWQPPWSFQNLAPAAHEMGHGFGLPHANNSDQDIDPYDNPWDVMSDSWDDATHSATYGTLPKELSIWSRELLGWIDAGRQLTLANPGTWSSIHLAYAELAGSSGFREIRIRPPGAPATETFTLEARQRAGTYDGNLAGTAVIVHHVKTTRSEPAWSVDRRQPPADVADNRESMFMVGDSYNLRPDVHISIDGQASDGFLVTIHIDGPIVDPIFKNGFD